MKNMNRLLLAIAVCLLSGCSTTRSSFDLDSPGKNIIYLADVEQIQTLIHTAMLQEFGGNVINVGVGSTIGYKSTVRVLLDSHDIAIYGKPIQGIDAEGKTYSSSVHTVLDS